MIDHIGVKVADIAASRDFYTAALAPLGIEVAMEVTEEMTGGHGAHIGFGRYDKPFFWIGSGGAAGGPLHVAFAAPDRELVDDFYTAAMRTGGRDNGEPGLRPDYHPHYYAAFVLDPDGNNIEAVCHTPPGHS